MDAVDLAFAGAARQAELIRSREVSARELTELYLERIERLDPQLNAYRVVFAERALAEADQADAPRQGGRHAAAARRPGRDQGRHGRRRRGDRVRQRRPRRPGGRRRRGRAPPARGRRGDPRQDARARADDHAVDRVADLRRHPQPVGPRSARRAARPAARRARSPPGSAAPRSAPTAPARSASPPPAAACSGSSRRTAACRPRRRSSRGTACRPGARSRAASPTARWSTTRSRTAGRRSPRPPRASPGRLRIAVSLKTPPLTGVQADAEQLGGVERGRRGAARARPRGDRARDRLPDRRWAATCSRATCAGSPTRRARCRTPSACRGARAATGGSARRSRDALLERAKAGRRRRRAGLGRVFDGVDAVLTPMFTRRPPRVGEYEGRPALWTLHRLGALRALLRRRQPHRPAGGVGARGLDGRRLPARRAARRAARRRAAAALARRAARGRAAAGPTGGRRMAA